MGVASGRRRHARALGQRLPAETSLAEWIRLGVPTIRQAFGVPRAEGPVESRHGIGTVVNDSAGCNAARVAATAAPATTSTCSPTTSATTSSSPAEALWGSMRRVRGAEQLQLGRAVA